MSAEAKLPPKPGKDTIYLDVDDEITSIIDKVEAAQQKVVALVLPKRATSLQSIVNMRLLKRSADTAGKSVVLITTEAALLPLAGAAGLHVAKSLQSKPEIPAGPNLSSNTTKTSAPEVEEETADNVDNLPNKIDYGKSIGELAEAHDIEHPETIELGEDEEAVETAAAATEKLPKAPKNKALKVPNFDKFRLFLGLGIVGLVALIVFIYLAIAVLPKATIAIQTTSTPVSANFTLTTSGTAKTYDAKNDIIPGFSQSTTQTDTEQVTATGQQNNGNKASGSAVMSAGTCGPTFPADVPAGTGISSNSLTFITQQKATFSAVNSGGTCTFQSDPITVIAQAGGAKYNLAAASSFTVAGYSGVTASNDAAFTGGSDNIQTVLSQADVDSVKQKLTSDMTDKFAKDYEDQLGSRGYYVLTSTLKQGSPAVSSTPAVGQPASNASVTIKVTYTVLTVQQADLKQAIINALKGQIDSSKQKLDDSELLNNASVSVASQASKTNASLNITENTNAIPLIDAASVKTQAAGQKTGTVTSSISATPGVKSVSVKLSPFWVSKVPNKPSKITVNIQHVANGS